MATITVRALSPTGEPLQGNGQGNFISDIDAVAQIIRTRLLLLAGEWWEDLTDGTPLFQSVLAGAGDERSRQAAALVFTARVLGSPYVESVSNVTTAWNSATRTFSFTQQANTPFGTITITFQSPGLGASLGY
jgi:hypothetical protein